MSQKSEARYRADCRRVVKLMRERFPNAADWHMAGNGPTDVHILDKRDNIIGRISPDDLTRYWNRVEGVGFIKGIPVVIVPNKEEAQHG